MRKRTLGKYKVPQRTETVFTLPEGINAEMFLGTSEEFHLRHVRRFMRFVENVKACIRRNRFFYDEIRIEAATVLRPYVRVVGYRKAA